MAEPKRNVAVLMERAVGYHQAGQLLDARKLYERVLRLQPKNPNALNLLGLIVAAQDNLERGTRLVRRAIAIFPQFPEAMINLGGLLSCDGRSEEALAAYERAIALRPSYAEAFNNRGTALYNLDRNEEALASYDQAIALRPNYVEAFNNRGNALASLDRDEEALASFDSAIALHPDFFEALVNRGNALRRLDRAEEALVSFDKVIALRPDYAEGFYNRGLAFQNLHRDEEAAANYARATLLQPAFAEAHKSMAATLRRLGRHAEAEVAYHQVLSLDPDDPGALTELALVVRDLGRFDEAVALLRRSISVDPDNARMSIFLALVLLEQDRTVEAETAALRGLGLAGEDSDLLADACHALGWVRYNQMRSQEAHDFYTRALALKPDRADTQNSIGLVHREAGRLADAHQAFERAVQLDPREVSYYFNLAELKPFSEDDAHLAAMEALAHKDTSLSATSRSRLDFALAKAHDGLGRHADAFRYMREGNALKRGLIDYNEIATHHTFDRIRATFDRQLIASKTGNGFRSALPVFVIGMPRSGTTLVEQILASHPSVHGAGELRDLAQLVDRMTDNSGSFVSYPEAMEALTPVQLRALGEHYVGGLQRLTTSAERVTDKMPTNFMFIGLIHLALPDARIIHVTRNPLDTCLSCFATLFTTGLDFTYELGELGRYYRKYAELMAHWHSVLPENSMIEIRYEDVIADVETEARRIIDYCGLPWHPGCSAFHEAQRPVRTASASQVRRPVYRTSEGRWHAYSDHLGPLVAALGA